MCTACFHQTSKRPSAKSTTTQVAAVVGTVVVVAKAVAALVALPERAAFQPEVSMAAGVSTGEAPADAAVETR